MFLFLFFTYFWIFSSFNSRFLNFDSSVVCASMQTAWMASRLLYPFPVQVESVSILLLVAALLLYQHRNLLSSDR